MPAWPVGRQRATVGFVDSVKFTDGFHLPWLGRKVLYFPQPPGLPAPRLREQVSPPFSDSRTVTCRVQGKAPSRTGQAGFARRLFCACSFLSYSSARRAVPVTLPNWLLFFLFSPKSRAQLFTQRKQGSDKVTEYTCCENMQAEAEEKKTFFHK